MSEIGNTLKLPDQGPDDVEHHAKPDRKQYSQTDFHKKILRVQILDKIRHVLVKLTHGES